MAICQCEIHAEDGETRKLWGFAFTLGLTTVIDIAVAFMFTRPLVALLAGNRWMAAGSPMTGVSTARLGLADHKEVPSA